MSSEGTVFVVDDDQEVTASLSWLIESVGYNTETYNNSKVFLDTFDHYRLGCLILDIRMPQISGLEVQKKLIDRNIQIPIIFITAHADVPMAIRAMKLGAVDFFCKPLNYQDLLESINKAIKKNNENRKFTTRKIQMRTLINKLTPREHEVFHIMMDGKITKLIAQELGISPHTAELHRINVMKKMDVSSLVELTKLSVIYNLTSE